MPVLTKTKRSTNGHSEPIPNTNLYLDKRFKRLLNVCVPAGNVIG